MSENKKIDLKGTKDGIIIKIIDLTDFEDVLKNLKLKFDTSATFFKDAEIVGVEGFHFNIDEKKILKKVIEKDYGLSAVSLESVIERKKDTNTISEDKTIKEKNEMDLKKQPKTKEILEKYGDCTKFIKGTIRSGRLEKHDGDIVILGDVNPGAEIIAAGNIVVMGSLKGVAHAGFPNNTDAFIVSLDFRPVQLRIGEVIARSPEEDEFEKRPEIAYLKNGLMVIESYL